MGGGQFYFIFSEERNEKFTELPEMARTLIVKLRHNFLFDPEGGGVLQKKMKCFRNCIKWQELLLEKYDKNSPT
jgi:hypothetical protein